MLEQMRLHQEALETGQRKRIPFSRATKSRNQKPAPTDLPQKTLSSTRWGEQIENTSSGSGSSIRSDDRRPWGWRTHHTGGDWFDRAKQGIAVGQTPLVKDFDQFDAQYPIESIEDSPLSHKGSARGTPATAHLDRKKAVKIVESADLLGDLSGSVLASTPAFPKKRYMSIKEALQGEKEAKRYQNELPTPPPEDMFQRNSHRVQQTVSNRRPAPQTAREKSQELVKNPLAIAKEALHAVLDSPKPIPQSQRDDTRNLLKLLARSTSNSPSPVQPEKKAVSPDTAPQQSKPTITARWQSIQNSIPQQLSQSSHTKPPTSASFPNNSLLSQPLPQHDIGTPANSKTPKPVGAWIETPAPKESSSRTNPTIPQQTTVKESKKSAQLPLLSRPKSALAAVLGLAKGRVNESAEDMGEATIHSLEDMLEGSDSGRQNADIGNNAAGHADIVSSAEDQTALRELLAHRITSELHFTADQPPSAKTQALIDEIVEQRIAQKTTQVPGKAREAEKDAKATTLTPRRKERMEEELQLQRMTDRVNTLSSYTASMRAGLKKLERGISSAGECGHCDCPGNCFGAHPFTALARAAFSVFVRTKDGNPGLTWVGVISVVMLHWMVLEALLCWSYCRPLYAYWSPTPFGPFEVHEPPYIVLSWIFGPIGRWLAVPRGLLSAMFRPIRGVILDMLADENVPTATVKSTLSRFASTATGVLAAASDWSMDGDEFL